MFFLLNFIGKEEVVKKKLKTLEPLPMGFFYLIKMKNTKSSPSLVPHYCSLKLYNKKCYVLYPVKQKGKNNLPIIT